MKHVIAGFSAAGLAALESLRARDSDGDVTVVSAELGPAYARVFLPELIAGRLTEERLTMAPPGHLDRLGVRVVWGTSASRLSVEDRTLTLCTGEMLAYDTLLIATGADAAGLGVPGEALPGVSPLRTLAHARAIRQAAASAREAVIAGAGLVGLKAAEALCDLGLKVTVVASSDHVLSQILDRQAASMVQAAMSERGVRFISGAKLLGFAGETCVSAAQLSDGSRLPCGVAVVAKGVVPSTGWLRGSPLTLRGGVVVDSAGRTGVPGIWAAGDVAVAPDALNGAASAHPIWPEAVSQGRAAGAAMGGERSEAMPALARNIGAIFGLPLMAIGNSRANGPAGDEESTTIWRSGGAYRKESRRQGRLVGVLQVGGMPSGYWQSLVRRQGDDNPVLMARRPTYGRTLADLPVTP